MTNKKAAIRLPLMTIISLVIASILLIVLFWLIFYIYSASLPRADIGTINTFNHFLVPAVEKATSEEKLVPYYIQKGYSLVSRVAAPNCCDKCLCIIKDDRPTVFSAKKHFKYSIEIVGSTISGTIREGKGPNNSNVKNVVVWKAGNTVYIKDTYEKTQ